MTRITERDGVTKEEALRRLQSQWSNSKQVEHANVVLSTLWQPEVTRKQVRHSPCHQCGVYRSALHKSIWLCNVRKLYSCLNFHVVFYFKRYWKRGIFFRRESRKGNRHSRNVLYHYIISAVTYRSSMYRAQGHVHTNDRSTRGNAALERSEGGYCAFAAKPSELLLWPRLSAWLTFHRFLNSSSRCLAKIKYRWTRKNTALEMIPNKMISGNLDAWD